MARKLTISNQIKKKRSREEEKRKVDIKSKRKFFLIVCEGEKTEPNYFISLKNDLPRGVLDVCDISIIGTGFNTNSLVSKAIELRNDWQENTYRAVDKLWVVFDKDSFTAHSFHKAIQMCFDNPNVDAAWTNEAFELWYLLHFHYYNTSISRKQYQSLIEKNFLNKGLTKFKYKKNSTEMFDLLSKYANINDAIKNATNLEKTFEHMNNFAQQNPCTKVHHLVAELYGLEQIINEDEITSNKKK